jgi:hypothetical protein
VMLIAFRETTQVTRSRKKRREPTSTLCAQ